MAPAQERSRAELLRRAAEEVPSPAEVYQRLAVLRPVCGTRVPGEPAPADAAANPHRAARAHVSRARTPAPQPQSSSRQTLGRRRGGNERAAGRAPRKCVTALVAASLGVSRPPPVFVGCLPIWGLSAFGNSTHFSFYHHPVTTAELASTHVFPSFQDHQNALALRPSVQSPREMHSLPCAHSLVVLILLL